MKPTPAVSTPTPTPRGLQAVPLAVWPCAQIRGQQRAGRYLPEVRLHSDKMLPEMAHRIPADYTHARPEPCRARPEHATRALTTAEPEPPAHGASDAPSSWPASHDQQPGGRETPVPPGWHRPLPQPDPRPGHYYVGVWDEGRRHGLLAGPFGAHPPALEMVDSARQAACELDPWAWFYAFGTCRTPDNRGPGRLNPHLGLTTGPDGLVVWPPPVSGSEVGEDPP